MTKDNLNAYLYDAEGRVCPNADPKIAFSLIGPATLAGLDNGDPTNHESDKASSRKAFSGLCMALVQSAKTAGNITVEASSPGLTPASVSISAKAVKLRPQVAVWEREVPAGTGVTGLWRPAPAPAAAGRGGGGFGGRTAARSPAASRALVERAAAAKLRWPSKMEKWMARTSPSGPET